MKTDVADRSHRPNAPRWVKLLVFLHLLAITIWTLPSVPDEIRDGRRKPIGTEWVLLANQTYLKSLKPVQTYMMATGMWQYWDMFAPNPMQVDVYCSADVTYADGTERPYPYPRVAEQSIPVKYFKERYRKLFERARLDQYSYMWPAFAQRIALLSANDPKNPPVRVRLHRHWLTIAGPGKPQEPSYGDILFFDYTVDGEKLAHDAGWR